MKFLTIFLLIFSCQTSFAVDMDKVNLKIERMRILNQLLAESVSDLDVALSNKSDKGDELVAAFVIAESTFREITDLRNSIGNLPNLIKRESNDKFQKKEILIEDYNARISKAEELEKFSKKAYFLERIKIDLAIKKIKLLLKSEKQNIAMSPGDNPGLFLMVFKPKITYIFKAILLYI